MLFLNILLIGNTPIRKESHRMSGQVFEFGIGGITAFDGDVQVSGDSVVRAVQQTVHEGHIVLVGGKFPQNRGIRKGFVHDDDDIGKGSFLRFLFRPAERLIQRSRIVTGIFAAVGEYGSGAVGSQNFLRLSSE